MTGEQKMNNNNDIEKSIPRFKKIDETLQKICAYECQQELTRWAKRKWSIVTVCITVCVVVISFFGFRSMIVSEVNKYVNEKTEWVDKRVPELERKVVEAEIVAEKARDSSMKADQKTAEYGTTLYLLGQKISTLQQDVQNLFEQVSEVGQKISNLQEDGGDLLGRYIELKGLERSNKALFEKRIEDFNLRLAVLDKLIRVLDQDSIVIKEQLDQYKQDSDRLQYNSTVAEEQFIKNSKYTVNVLYNSKTKKLYNGVLSLLTDKGFRVSDVDVKIAQDTLRHLQKTRRLFLDFDLLDCNMIVYKALNKDKAEEIHDLLTTLPEVSNVEKISEEEFTKRFGSTPIFTGRAERGIIAFYFIHE